ncbi:MAG: exodeoxyribonuclease III [Alphaproteobacteria bacterium]|nr:exodeoxyribonuclease III [Alphaproteobacteria bacterium]OJV45647.1 MAG: exodeoxyribonuclease III [Alphaproteobacteria bacterium 43-37]
MSVKIATWNVNSVRARLTHLLSWLADSKPDIVLLQEVKVTTEQFPYEPIEELGYNIQVHGQKSYNGVAILSKFPIEDLIANLPNRSEDTQSRYIEAFTGGYKVASVYVPNGQSVGSEKFAYKLEFMESLKQHLATLVHLDEPVFIGGDYNIIFDDRDVYDPEEWREQIMCSAVEKQALKSLQFLGYCDVIRLLHPTQQLYSWWDYRQSAFAKNQGIRIDHILASPLGMDKVHKAGIDEQMRAQSTPSDHAPVWITVG